MADPTAPEEGTIVVDVIQIVRMTDEVFGLVVVTNPDPKPGESKGFWVQLSRESVEDLRDQVAIVLDDQRWVAGEAREAARKLAN